MDEVLKGNPRKPQVLRGNQEAWGTTLRESRSERGGEETETKCKAVTGKPTSAQTEVEDKGNCTQHSCLDSE